MSSEVEAAQLKDVQQQSRARRARVARKGRRVLRRLSTKAIEGRGVFFAPGDVRLVLCHTRRVPLILLGTAVVLWPNGDYPLPFGRINMLASKIR